MNMIKDLVISLSKEAKRASYQLATLNSESKNKALHAIAQALWTHKAYIIAENTLDMKISQEKKLNHALLDRLLINDQRLDAMIDSINNIISLPDPVGKLITSKILSNGMHLQKVRVPLGVVLVIFESRPNVITDVAALCLKSGNAAILRGGSEAFHTNQALAKIINDALMAINFISCAVQMVPVLSKEAVTYLCGQSQFIDVIIPRGGESLIKAVTDCASIPVIKHYKGVCHAYVDKACDLNMAISICYNGKCQRPGVCNALESILVHQDKAHEFLPLLWDKFKELNVDMRGCEKSLAILPDINRASDFDWGQEFLDLIVTVKVVQNIDEAISHINNYGSHHSDVIISLDKHAQQRFIKEIDSACIYVNASTRFSDGGMFGLGCEIGISTDKLHARGPMGLEELTTYKWVALGNGQIRE